jgi:tetratricopeptide (TPR) repeat protein
MLKPGRDMVDAGLLYRVVQEGEEVSLRDFWKEYSWHTLDEAETRGDLTAEFVLADYNFGRGRYYLARGEIDEGLEAFEKSLKIAGTNKETLNNLASACAEHGQFDAAAKYYTRALELDPDYEIALRNLGKLRMQMEKYDEALEQLERLVEKLPRDYEANWIMARCLENLGRVDDALAQLQKLSEIAPESDEVFREMGMIYLNEKQDMETARRMFARSLSLNPNQPGIAMLMTQQQQRMEGPQMPGLLPPMPKPALPQLPEMPTLPRP